MTEEELPMFNLQRQETKHAYEQDNMKTNNELLVEIATQDVISALKLLETTQDGLSKQEVARRLSLYGPNEIAHNKWRRGTFNFCWHLKIHLFSFY